MQEKRRRRRTTSLDLPEEIARLSPFGKRLHAIWASSGLGLGPFGELIGLSDSTVRVHIVNQLDKDNEIADSIELKELIAYARYGKVSLHWLITGRGQKSAWLDGWPEAGEDSVLARYPEELFKAAKALGELDDEVSHSVAKELMAAAFEEAERKGVADERSPDEWLAALKQELKSHNKRSGTKLSSKPRIKTKATKGE